MQGNCSLNTSKGVCVQCDVRIPKYRRQLICHLCDLPQHFKCNNLSKNEALKIINNTNHLSNWICQSCLRAALPVNAIKSNKSRSATNTTINKISCSCCKKYSNCPKKLSVCRWCDLPCHIKKCQYGQLGCINCCENIIPGFRCSNRELMNHPIVSNKLYNPYDQESLVNQIGDKIESQDENLIWTELSEKLLQCKYTSLENISHAKEGELTVLSLNIRSLINNIDEIRANIEHYKKFDAICLCETNCNTEKLPNGIDDLLIEGFHKLLIQAPARKSCKGGGLAFYINKSTCNEDDFEHYEFENCCNTDGEFLFLKLKLQFNKNSQTKTYIIGNVYRSPSAKPEKFIEKLEIIFEKLNRHKSKHIILAGDVNIDLLKHDTDVYGTSLIDCFANYGFVQLISRPTRITDHSSTLIDHIYTNSVQHIISTRVVTLDISDHLGTCVTIELSENFSRMTFNNIGDSYEKRSFNAVNTQKFNELMENETWDDVYSQTDTETKFENFSKIYNQHYNLAFGIVHNTRRKKQRKNPKPWIMPWLEEACDRKNRLYNTFIKEPSIANKIKYTKMKKFTDKHIKKAKNKYYQDYFEKYSTNSRMQWQMLNSLLNRNNKKSTITRLRDKDGNVMTSPLAIANEFNNYFSNIASDLKSQSNTNSVGNTSTYRTFLTQNNHVPNTIFLAPTDTSEISEIIISLKPKSTSDIKICTMKAANDHPNFTAVLTNVINSSLEEGIFLSELKIAKVIPIFKNKGDELLVSNYRPISLLSNINKIFENLAYSRLYSFLNLYKLYLRTSILLSGETLNKQCTF